jgi:hypothetical protein
MTEAMPVAGGDRRSVPRARRNTESGGGSDPELEECLDDADLKDAARRTAGKEKADLFRGSEAVVYHFGVIEIVAPGDSFMKRITAWMAVPEK